MDTPDSTLAERLKNGDDAAFDEIMWRHRAKTLTMAYHVTGNMTDAEDIAQETFVLVYRKIGRFRGDSSLGTWIYSIAVNLCRSHNRRRKFLDIFAFGPSDDPEEPAYEVAVPPESADRLESAELRKMINKAVSTLPARQKEVFVMKHIHEMKIQDIATVLDCAEGTVKAHLFKAVRNLQQRLREYRKG